MPLNYSKQFSELDAAFFRKYNAKNYFTERNAALKQHVLKAANSDAGGDWRPRDSDRKTEKTMNTINYLSL